MPCEWRSSAQLRCCWREDHSALSWVKWPLLHNQHSRDICLILLNSLGISDHWLINSVVYHYVAHLIYLSKCFIISKIDVECSQSVFKQNLKQCLIEKITCLHCSKIQWSFVVFFLLFCLTFVMQANRIPFVSLCCTFDTLNEIVGSESDIGTRKPKRFQSPLSHTSVNTTGNAILVLYVLFELTAKLICLCALP